MPTVTIDTTSQWYGVSGPQPEADVCVLHTTEGMSWPGYSGGGNAPHDTLRPLPGVGVTVRKHIPYSSYAKALVHLPGTVETNRRGALQFELMGTCDPKMKSIMYYWPEADDVVLEALADYLRPLLAQFAIPHQSLPFKAYPSSYGNSNARLTVAQWLAFQGICAHMHVPFNVHGDAGAFPIGRLIAFLNKDVPGGKPAPVTVIRRTDPVLLKTDGDLGPATISALQKYLKTPIDGKISRPSDMVKALQRYLNAHGAKLRVDGLGFAQDDQVYETVKALQKYLGTAVDGRMSSPKSAVVAQLQRRLNTGRL